MSAPDWFTDRIYTGLQRLYSLSLRDRPAADVLPATADTWVSVLWPGLRWDEARDLPRLTEAFRVLAGKVDRWPAPRELRDCLPPIPDVQALPPPKYRADPDRIAKARAIIRKLTERLTLPPGER